MRFKYTYDKGLVNRYGHPIPDNYATLPTRMQMSFAMQGNANAKGSSRMGRTRESVALGRILDRIEDWRDRERREREDW